MALSTVICKSTSEAIVLPLALILVLRVILRFFSKEIKNNGNIYVVRTALWVFGRRFWLIFTKISKKKLKYSRINVKFGAFVELTI